MALPSVRMALADALADLTPEDLDKFCRALVDRKEEPRVRRNKVQSKNFLDVADVLVTTFTEDKAIGVAVDLLQYIGCMQDAKSLREKMGGPGPSNTAAPSAGAAAGNATAGAAAPSAGAAAGNATAGAAAPSAGAAAGNATAGGEHFVDKHRLELTNRVTNISPILDELLVKKVIQQEKYDEIVAVPTSQDQMRKLYNGCLKAGRACKDIFYENLVKYEPYLIDELKGK